MAFRRKEASWRKMLLWRGGEQESVGRVKVLCRGQSMAGMYVSTGYLEAGDGVRMGMVWDLTRDACETEDKGQFLMKWRIDAFGIDDNHCIDMPLTNGRRPRLVLFRRMRDLVWGRRIPIETRYVNLGNRVDVEEDEDVLEISTSTYTTCVGRDMHSPPPKRLGEEFESEAYENSNIKYGEPMHDSAFENSAAVFRAQLSRRRANLLGIF